MTVSDQVTGMSKEELGRESWCDCKIVVPLAFKNENELKDGFDIIGLIWCWILFCIHGSGQGNSYK